MGAKVKKTPPFLKIFLLSFLALLLSGTIFLFIFGSKAPLFISQKCTELLGTPVKIEDIHFSISAIELTHLEIENPKSYTLSHAFKAEKIELEAPLVTYVKNHIEIEKVEIKNIYLGLEFDTPTGAEGNWSTILSQDKKSSSQKTTPSSKTVLIKKIILRNIKTDLLYQNGNGKVKHLPTIKYLELTNVGSEGTDVLEQITDSALGSLLKQVFIKENLKNMLNDFLDSNGNLNKTLKPLQKFFK